MHNLGDALKEFYAAYGSIPLASIYSDYQAARGHSKTVKSQGGETRTGHRGPPTKAKLKSDTCSMVATQKTTIRI